jgi:outer membrane protein OmpA-like peptidoglycan-associated protein
VKFIGCASSDGSDGANDALSAARAKAFERAFLGKEFSDPSDKGNRGLTRAEGKGNADPDADKPGDRFAKIRWAASSSK